MRDTSHEHEQRDRTKAREEADRQSRERDEAKAKAEAHRRRADARASVELEYTRLAAQLSNTFTREMLKEYVGAYLGDEHPPDDVERRGKDLIAYLEAQVDQKDRANTTSLDDLDAWHQTEKQRIESSPADERLKRRLLAALNVRYAELAAKIMEELEP